MAKAAIGKAGDQDLHASPRRTPAQQRSRERLDVILTVAKRLIAERGSDQVKMSEIAELAGISIGSLYQYFPDKRSIIRTLAERYNADSRRCIEVALAGVADLPGLRTAYLGLYDTYYALFLGEPVMRDIWTGMQADKELMALQAEESRICAAMLAAAVRRAHGISSSAALASSAFLIWELGEATVRLAILQKPREGRRLVEAFKRMTVREIMQPEVS